MPLNRLRAALSVYGRHIEVLAIITVLILIGGIAGYAIARVETAALLTNAQIAHLAEIDRLQSAHSTTVGALTKRLDGISARQEKTADKVESAAGVAKEAADTAKSALREK